MKKVGMWLNNGFYEKFIEFYVEDEDYEFFCVESEVEENV